MRRNPENTAWVVLIGAFCIFCALALLVPLGLRWWIQNAAETEQILMASNGTVLVTRPGRTTAEVNLTDIPVGSAIEIDDANSQATLTFNDPNSRVAVASVKIYGNTRVNLTRADSPRYAASQVGHTIELQVDYGRLRATSIVSDADHRVTIELVSPPNAVTVMNDPQSEVALVVGSQTSLTVRQGRATIRQSDGPQGSPGELELGQDQRAEVASSGLRGPLSPERRLIANGDFLQPLDQIATTNNWVVAQPQQNDDIPGTVTVEDEGDRKVVHFYRQGIDLLWGQVGITQNINQDVRDFTTLRLQLDVLVSHQDLFNCGEFGTECPVMVQIAFQDTAGHQKKWLQGFYYNYSDRPGTGMTKCPSCDAVRSDHQRVAQDQWVSIETDNLVDLLRGAGTPPAQVQSISIYASGHAFDSEITNVQLLGSE